LYFSIPKFNSALENQQYLYFCTCTSLHVVIFLFCWFWVWLHYLWERESLNTNSNHRMWKWAWCLVCSIWVWWILDDALLSRFYTLKGTCINHRPLEVCRLNLDIFYFSRHFLMRHILYSHFIESFFSIYYWILKFTNAMQFIYGILPMLISVFRPNLSNFHKIKS